MCFADEAKLVEIEKKKTLVLPKKKLPLKFRGALEVFSGTSLYTFNCDHESRIYQFLITWQ